MTPTRLHQAVVQAAARHPRRPAIVSGGADQAEQVVTYGDLERRSGAAAAALLERGVVAGGHVGVWMPKSPAAVMAQLAILRAGGVYVPLDPYAPTARIERLAADGGLCGLLADPARAELSRAWTVPPPWCEAWEPAGPAGEHWGNARALPESPARPDEAVAYILYTSGSTGTPKGVLLSHRHALAFIAWAAVATALAPADRVASHAPFHFDLSIFDLWASLSRGAAVCLLDPVTARFPAATAAWMRQRQISVWYSVPTALAALAPYLAECGGKLRQVLFAGEVFPASALAACRRALPRARFANWYGPTETNVCAAYAVPDWPALAPDPLPIGRACPQFELRLLADGTAATAAPVAEGERGRLWAGGTVMAGYWGDPDRTASVLQADADGRTWYNTGDWARRGDDGELYFLGRDDAQVKYRGYRVSLLEIERILQALPGVAQAVVLAPVGAAAGAGLEAYVVPVPGAALEETAVRQHCARQLPVYMIPEHIAILAALPLTATGKLDRARLRPPANGVAAPARPLVPIDAE